MIETKLKNYTKLRRNCFKYSKVDFIYKRKTVKRYLYSELIRRKPTHMRFVTAVVLLFAIFACQSIKSEKDTLVLENEMFSKSFYFSKEKPGSIWVEYMDKTSGKVLTSGVSVPFFEFVVNNHLVSSNDKDWVFRGQQTREMRNGGTEYTLVFEGRKGNVNGLQVILKEQLFPNSTLMREKLELRADGKSFQLNKLNGKLHFRFPSYSVVNNESKLVESTEIRIASWEKTPITFGDKKKGNHMYYPDIVKSAVEKEGHISKGPISIISDGGISWMSAYEHASQDNLNGLFNKQKVGSGNQINDAMQGVKGVFNFPLRDEDFLFLGISSVANKKSIDVSVDMFRGGYLDGEIIDKNHPYSTVWTATGFYNGNDLETGKKMIRNYLFHQICEKPASRIPEYYYNTWGLQREDRSKPLRGILTYDRIFKEIDIAAELGVDIFVLDDGWENKQGEWFPHKERFPQGLAPVKERLDKYGIKMGLWFSPMGIDTSSQRYKDHPEWVIKDSEGDPILAQWDHPAFDFVGGFFNVFIDDCKKLIDQGCRFMKWDAINTFYSRLPNLEHGSDKYSEQEIRARYEYLLPIYVTRAMKILTDYEPELVIEMDLTEARRVMVGLAPLSEGKLFWMNNGASGYNDYSTYRTKSMRTIANEFAGIIPLELFTYANYPQNVDGCMKYNLANSLLAGHGFWGNLELMTSKERKWVGEQVAISKKVLPYTVDTEPLVIGKVGDSPEIYSIVNKEEAAGQIIVFSEKPFKKEFSTDVNAEKLLAVLNQPFTIENNHLNVTFQSSEKESSIITFLIPNNDSGISICSSTSPVKDVKQQNGWLEYTVSFQGKQVILWNKKRGIPVPGDKRNIEMEITENDKFYVIEISEKKDNLTIVIRSE